MLSKLGKGDEVITRGGMIGKITGVSDDGVLVLELQEKVRVRVPRAYVEAKWEGKVPEPRREDRRLICLALVRSRCFMDRSLKWRTLLLVVGTSALRRDARCRASCRSEQAAAAGSRRSSRAR